MAAQSQEASLQCIDWPSQIRAELHEPINGSDSSGPAGNLRSNHIACFHPPFYISQCLYSPLFFPSRRLFRSIIRGPEIMVMNRHCYYVTFKGTAYIWEGEMRDWANLWREIRPFRGSACCCQTGWWGQLVGGQGQMLLYVPHCHW